MISGKSITLVIPAHNEEIGLLHVLEQVPGEVDRIIVVDNCSTDGTAGIAASFGCRVVKQPLKGYGHAYQAGFKAVETDLIATTDADGTYPVDRIPSMVKILLEEQLDFISGRRKPDDHARNLNNVMRFTGNFVLSAATMLLYMHFIKDSQSGMWVFHREILDRIKLTSGGMPFSEELKIEVWSEKDIRCREVDIPFSYSERMGDAKLRLWRDGFRNLLFLFAKRIGIPMTKA
ncbi:MAG: glycosyltransferase family 2 protein [Candidatus Aegiribacteria sp.]|nr:glycosyltransferase family 2 protein [Candidatus Aegiribacteria sp.]